MVTRSLGLSLLESTAGQGGQGKDRRDLGTAGGQESPGMVDSGEMLARRGRGPASAPFALLCLAGVHAENPEVWHPAAKGGEAVLQ